MEHGFTPAAVISRIMAESVPDQIQVSIASGLLTIGNVHAGTMEGCAALLTEGVKAQDQDEWCKVTLARFRERKKAVPGFGHKLHKPDDPRTPPLLDVARSNALDGPHVRLLLKLSTMIDEAAGKHITINATGAIVGNRNISEHSARHCGGFTERRISGAYFGRAKDEIVPAHHKQNARSHPIYRSD